MVDIKGSADRVADYLKRPKRALETLTTAWDFNYMSKIEVGCTIASFGLTVCGVANFIDSGFGLLNVGQGLAGGLGVLFGQGSMKHYYNQTSRMEKDYKMVEGILKNNENNFGGVFEELEKDIKENGYDFSKVFSWDVDKDNWDNWTIALINSYCKKQGVKTELEEKKDEAIEKRKGVLESRKSLETLADA